jgi:hypothetical protein
VLAVLVLLGAYTLGQVTSSDSAQRIIGRAIPSITDFDHAFAAHYDELVTAANAPGAGAGITLSSYPVQVSVSQNEILHDSPAEVRHLLLLRTADAVYNRGIDAFSPDGRPVKLGSAGILSGPWAFKTALSLLNPHVHSELVQGAKIALAATAVLGLLLLVLARDYNRIVMLGAAVFIAAIPGLAISALAWLFVQIIFGSSSDPLIAGTSDIARDVTWYVILSYLVFAALGVGLFILGLIAERVGSLVASSADPAHKQEYSA